MIEEIIIYRIACSIILGYFTWIRWFKIWDDSEDLQWEKPLPDRFNFGILRKVTSET